MSPSGSSAGSVSRGKGGAGQSVAASAAAPTSKDRGHSHQTRDIGTTLRLVMPGGNGHVTRAGARVHQESAARRPALSGFPGEAGEMMDGADVPVVGSAKGDGG